MSLEIINVLRELDADNIEHWTQDGLPALGVVKERLGRMVTRAEITEAARGFHRGNPVIPIDSTMRAKSEEAENRREAERAAREASNARPTLPERLERPAESVPEDAGDTIEGEAVEVVDPDLAARMEQAKADLEALEKEHDELTGRLTQARKLYQQVSAEHTRENTPRNLAIEIRKYQQSQAAQRAANSGGG